MPTKSIQVPAANDVDALLKTAALGTIATLDAASLQIIAKAVSKHGAPGAGQKLKQYQSFL